MATLCSAAKKGQEFAMSTFGLLNKVRGWHQERALKRELEQLTDRQLADIGLRREQIEFVTRGGMPMARPLPI